MDIRITKTPPGEAPEAIRSAWVGLLLPLAVSGPRTVPAVGVLSRPKTFFGWLLARLFGRIKLKRGYLVESHRAIELLAAQKPEAAKWWRENTPRYLQPGR